MIASRRRRAFERGALWAMDLAGSGKGSPLPQQRAAPTLVLPHVAAVFGEVRRESAELLATAMGLPDPEPILRRFATGRRCFAVWVEDQIAAYGWVSQAVECIGELEREIQISADEAYIWDCVTLPLHRRRRLYSTLLSYIAAQLRGEGVRRAWIGSSLGNRPSIRGFANAGFQPVVTLIYARFFNLCCLSVIGHPTASGELIVAARRALTADGERAWGSFVVGRSGPTQFPACAQIEV